MRLAAVSYDDVDVLNKFGKSQKIRYALLSDAGSKTIDAFGIRNKEAKGSRIDGVPHPGTILIDKEGIVRAKLFYDGYRKRHLAKDIVKAVAELPKPEKKSS